MNDEWIKKREKNLCVHLCDQYVKVKSVHVACVLHSLTATFINEKQAESD